MGRPSSYTQEIADTICERLAGGESVLSICSDSEMPAQSTVFLWLLRNPTFSENYARARTAWAESEFERMMQIADTPQLGIKTKTTDKGTEVIEGDMTEHRKLQVDTRKWALARMFPKKYGDATMLKHADPDGNAINFTLSRVETKQP